MNRHADWQSVIFEPANFTQHRKTDHCAAQSLHKSVRRRRSAARRKNIINDEHASRGTERVQVNFQRIVSVFQCKTFAGGFARNLEFQA